MDPSSVRKSAQNLRGHCRVQKDFVGWVAYFAGMEPCYGVATSEVFRRGGRRRQPDDGRRAVAAYLAALAQPTDPGSRPGFDLGYEVVDKEPLVVLMPSDHRLTAREAIHPRELIGEIFIGGSNKATVLRKVSEDYLQRSGLEIKLDHGVDNMAMAMSLVASTRGLALMPAYARNLLPWSVVSRPLEGEAPTIDLAVGYNRANSSPILQLFLSRLGELRAHALTQKH